jgi:hypothetical protein
MMRRYPHLFWAKLLPLLLAGLVLAGCSAFQRDWRSALNSPPPSTGIEGPWEGTWRSEVTGHSGRLRCLIVRDGGAQYTARFRASYLRWLRFGYTLTLQVQAQSNLYSFVGEASLPKWAGGRYLYSGHATATNFLSTYQCARDHGVLELHRP